MFGLDRDCVIGDTRYPGTLNAAVAGAGAVICATGTRTFAGANGPEQVDYRGVGNLVAAARMAEVPRFILITSLAVTKPGHPLNKLGDVLTWKFRGEEVLRTSGLTYTIIRPGGLTDVPGGREKVEVGQGDLLVGRISRADVAAVAVLALENRATHNTTFELVNTGSPPPTGWNHRYADPAVGRILFSNLTPDAAQRRPQRSATTNNAK
jgi:uncharacterized protein YbjT (DUF2867 family)